MLRKGAGVHDLERFFWGCPRTLFGKAAPRGDGGQGGAGPAIRVFLR